MLNDVGTPVRALYGGLPGQLQTVGRAERYAVLQVLRAAPQVQVVVSDLLGLVQEATSWRESLAGAAGKHATIWRAIFDQVKLNERASLQMRWTPAHLSYQGMVDNQIPIVDWLGNKWADLFAKMGARSIMVDHDTVLQTKAKLAEAIARAKYVYWAALQVRTFSGTQAGRGSPIARPRTQSETCYWHPSRRRCQQRCK